MLAGMVFLSRLQIALMGLLGEYVSRILDQVRARPMYRYSANRSA